MTFIPAYDAKLVIQYLRRVPQAPAREIAAPFPWMSSQRVGHLISYSLEGIYVESTNVDSKNGKVYRLIPGAYLNGFFDQVSGEHLAMLEEATK